MLKIRPIMRSDFQSIIDLTNEEGWGFGTADLKRMKSADPKGCLIATVDRKPAGFALAIAYGRAAGWIGNVVVDKQLRGAGLGSSLVRSGIRRLFRAHVKKIGLFTYPENEAMYVRLGFETTGTFERQSLSHGTGTRSKAGKIPLRQILDLDRQAFGADRSRLLGILCREFRKRWTWITSNGKVSGYALVKEYQDSSEIGPLICDQTRQEHITRLLTSSIALTGKWPLEITVPEANPSVIQAAMRLGFHVEKKGFMMSYSKLSPVMTDSSIGAFGFLDKG
jgi:ribosomal protein S18 acetylase RimI-like enzyme